MGDVDFWSACRQLCLVSHPIFTLAFEKMTPTKLEAATDLVNAFSGNEVKGKTAVVPNDATGLLASVTCLLKCLSREMGQRHRQSSDTDRSSKTSIDSWPVRAFRVCEFFPPTRSRRQEDEAEARRSEGSDGEAETKAGTPGGDASDSDGASSQQEGGDPEAVAAETSPSVHISCPSSWGMEAPRSQLPSASTRHDAAWAMQIQVVLEVFTEDEDSLRHQRVVSEDLADLARAVIRAFGRAPPCAAPCMDAAVQLLGCGSWLAALEDAAGTARADQVQHRLKSHKFKGQLQAVARMTQFDLTSDDVRGTWFIAGFTRASHVLTACFLLADSIPFLVLCVCLSD